ncbi:S-layer homology domain-containing protein [Candidatus Villigracilis affinis]|uniref:S-layer homology domain-containing protein n=1 Tax=Candidatus Villigracilis affinis TaxID=3140682 RepID=UPI002A20AD65|nr:S-layer homology domain-containing protein [Anaerolineales bacterium]
MSKKIFTVLLLVVFMLAQFSIASALVVAGDASITAIPDFANAVDVDVDWAVTGMAGPSQNILIWSRIQNAVPVAYSTCYDVATIIGTSDASGTFTYTLPVVLNGDVVEFLITVESTNCAGAVAPLAAEVPMGETTVDSAAMVGLFSIPPYDGVAAFGSQPVACNNFELWALATDNWSPIVPAGTGYSGFGAWNPLVTGTFVPAPIGANSSLLSWNFSIPSTATGAWSMSVNPEDASGNMGVAAASFRTALAIAVGETDECVTFSDISGSDYETYVRYLATLGLISGFADGTFGPDTNLSRAEASTLIEISNGVSDTDPGFGTPPAAGSACDFSDVSATDWFAGWVWQACDDGYMNGVGGGLFDPNNLLTRGQIVTIMNNVALSAVVPGGFLATANVMQGPWGTPFPYRTAAWTDVSVGAFYAIPVVNAYGVGVAEGTSATTFSPDQAATRGEFAMMLYRALSQVAPLP